MAGGSIWRHRSLVALGAVPVGRHPVRSGPLAFQVGRRNDSETYMNGKVIVKLDQGLGNQLFQLAYAIWAARGDIGRLVIDASWYDCIPADQTHRSLSVIGIIQSMSIPVLSLEEIHQFRPMTIDTTSSLWDVYCEQIRFIADEHPVYLIGRGFNYAYIKDAKAILQGCMHQAPIDISGEDASFFSENSVVGIHIRKGDYLNSNIRTWIGIVDMADQIREAERVIASHDFNQPVKIVAFSNGPVDYPFDKLFISSEAGGTYCELETLKLMSMCDWLVTANSTYSIFAAYLGQKMRGASLPMRYANVRHDLSTSLIGPRMVLYDNRLV